MKITYAGPFQQWNTSEPTEYFQVNKGGDLPHILGVWSKDPFESGLLIAWGDAGQIEVTSFKRGEWEAHLSE